MSKRRKLTDARREVLQCMENSNVLMQIMERLVPCCANCRINVLAAALAASIQSAKSDLDQDISMVREFYLLAKEQRKAEPNPNTN